MFKIIANDFFNDRFVFMTFTECYKRSKFYRYRYKAYDWAIIELHDIDPMPYYTNNFNLRFPCDSPNSISCNTTGNGICILSSISHVIRHFNDKFGAIDNIVENCVRKGSSLLIKKLSFISMY